MQINAGTQGLIPSNRQLYVALLDEADVETEPEYKFSLTSNLVLVKGQELQTEYVTTSLKLQNYYVFVYLDTNGNGLVDEGELANFAQTSGEPQLFTAERNRTKTVSVALSPFLAP